MSRAQPPRGQPRSRSVGLGARFAAWLDHHRESLRDALRRLMRRPIGQLLSMLVIALSLTLPITLLLTLHAARTGLGGWSHELGLVQVFLRPAAALRDGAVEAGNDVKGEAESDEALAERVFAELRADPRLREVRLIPPEEGLRQLAELHQFDGLLDEIKSNPLPAVIELYPHDHAGLAALREELAARPEVISARINAQAVERLHGLIDAGERLLMLFLLLLAPTLAITVSNTIRLELEHRADEIRLLQLMGATAGFIRRPLLYAGGLLGLGGALMGLALTLGAVRALMDALSGVGWSFPIPDSPPALLFAVLPAGFILGVIAAWLASVLQMRHIRPV